jgi:anti-sigma B factor antagonist
MDYRIETIGDATVVRLRGAFDRSARGKLEMELLALASYGSSLILDLSDVDYISSAGLHLLLELHRRCEGQNASLALTGISERIHAILFMTGLAPGMLPIFDTLEDGLSALRSRPKPASGSRGFTWDDAPAPSAPLPSAPAPPPSATRGDENGGEEEKAEAEEEVNFSAFYPKEVTVGKWHTLLVYMFVPSVLEAVREDARRFEDEIGEIRESKPSTTRLARGSEITIVPACEGVTFNPERISFQWLEDRHRAQFRLRADASLADTAGNAQVTIYVGPLIVGTLKMGMLFNETEADPGSARSEETSARMYHQDDIFISYSHRDTEVVRNCKKAYEALGHNVLIDFETLRSGQKWNAELMRMIERADIFQLFWSENSSKSKYCRQEWQYALELNRGEGFIRPVYWQEPIPDPPAELGDLHFDFAPFAAQD